MRVKQDKEPSPEKLKQRQEAGEQLLQWLQECPYHEYYPDNSEQNAVRLEQQSYARGYNDCRAEAMRIVADLILQRDVDDDDSGCDCC